MSKMARHERVRRMIAREDCYFIGDKGRGFYHRKDCGYIDRIVKRDLEACGPNPETQGFKPCLWCKPEPVRIKKDRPTSKAEQMRRAMEELADRHRMHLAFNGGMAMVTTIAGEWFFDYNQRPIRLHHKNNEVWYRADGSPTGHYHVQALTFPTPLTAMAYIYQHERAAERLAFGEREEDKQPPHTLDNP